MRLLICAETKTNQETVDSEDKQMQGRSAMAPISEAKKSEGPASCGFGIEFLDPITFHTFSPYWKATWTHSRDRMMM